MSDRKRILLSAGDGPQRRGVGDVNTAEDAAPHDESDHNVERRESRAYENVEEPASHAPGTRLPLTVQERINFVRVVRRLISAPHFQLLGDSTTLPLADNITVQPDTRQQTELPPRTQPPSRNELSHILEQRQSISFQRTELSPSTDSPQMRARCPHGAVSQLRNPTVGAHLHVPANPPAVTRSNTNTRMATPRFSTASTARFGHNTFAIGNGHAMREQAPSNVPSLSVNAPNQATTRRYQSASGRIFWIPARTNGQATQRVTTSWRIQPTTGISRRFLMHLTRHFRVLMETIHAANRRFLVGSRASHNNSLGLPDHDLRAPIPEKFCWICFEGAEENDYDNWCHPCACTGTAKWVHETCLLRWIDQVQQGNELAPVYCPQCRREYIIFLPPEPNNWTQFLQTCENWIERVTPRLRSLCMLLCIHGIMSMFGAMTFSQMMGHEVTSDSSSIFTVLFAAPTIGWTTLTAFCVNWRSLMYSAYARCRHWLVDLPVIGSYFAERRVPAHIEPVLPLDLQQFLIALERCFSMPTIAFIIGRGLFFYVRTPYLRMALGGLTFAALQYGQRFLRRHMYLRMISGRRILSHNAENRREYNQQRSLRNAINNYFRSE